jgi:large subunit ribosomal protein L4
MTQITLKKTTGKSAGKKVELDERIFGVQPNVPLMHQVVTAQLARRRAGTQSTKTRAEVAGGGAKPYRQKGTGNARQGSITAPHYAGGGVALGPKPRSYGQKTPKKMIRAALRSALSDRAADGKVLVVDSWGWDTPSTKQARTALAALGLEGKVLVVVGRDDAAAALSFRNLPAVQLIAPGELNAYDVLCNDWIVFTESTLPVVADTAVADEVVADDETAVDEVVADDTVADEVVADEVVADEVVADDTVADEVVADDTVAEDTVVDETAADETDADDEKDAE